MTRQVQTLKVDAKAARIQAASEVLFLESPEFDLACVGTSISGLTGITVDALTCIFHADVVYYYPLTPTHREFIRLLNSNAVDLNSSIYVKGRNYAETYDDVVNTVLNAVRSGNRVVYAQQGSPAYLAFTARRVYRQASKEGFRALLVPGVSSLEYIISKLIEREDVTDFFLLSCADLANGERSLDSRSSCFLVNWAHYMSGTRRGARVDPDEKITRFVASLRSVYPSDHRIAAYVVAPTGAVSSSECIVGSLSAEIVDYPMECTFYIPPITRN